MISQPTLDTTLIKLTLIWNIDKANFGIVAQHWIKANIRWYIYYISKWRNEVCSICCATTEMLNVSCTVVWPYESVLYTVQKCEGVYMPMTVCAWNLCACDSSLCLWRVVLATFCSLYFARNKFVDCFTQSQKLVFFWNMKWCSDLLSRLLGCLLNWSLQTIAMQTLKTAEYFCLDDN